MNDEHGRWEDHGGAWVLVDPSQAWLDAHPEPTDDPTPPPPAIPGVDPALVAAVEALAADVVTLSETVDFLVVASLEGW